MSRNILIMGVNWLGDSVMSLPAIEAFRKKCPDCKITVLVKDRLLGFWNMVPVIDDVLMIQRDWGGTLRTARRIQVSAFDAAYVLPNSFRSALLPFLGNVPRRIGMRGHSRSAMLTEVTQPVSETEGRMHQSWEYADILGLKPSGFPGAPHLKIPEGSVSKVRELIPAGEGALIALIPGAAFGDAKRWPAERFCEVGRSAMKEHGARVVVLGAPSESDVCAKIVADLGAGAVSVAGRTDLAEMAGLLQMCDFAVSNDCGGMHMAAAMGVKTVAVFGMTDPDKTGPLGDGHRIVCAEGSRSRDISRGSAEARQRMASISSERVYSELSLMIKESAERGA